MLARNTGRIVVLLALLCLAAAPGCIISVGPDREAIPAWTHPPMLQLGDVSETFTGTWSTVAAERGFGFKSGFVSALSKPELAPIFSGAPTGMTLHAALTSDHEDDGVRLFGLGCLSIATIGIIPLHYHAEWTIQCSASLRLADGTVVATYPLQERGTYSCWAMPLTMFSLLGAGIRGADDGAEMNRRVTHNLAVKLVKAVEADYPRLASFGEAAALAAGQQPLVVGIGGVTYWARYEIAAASSEPGAAPAGQRYLIHLYTSRPDKSSTPLRTLVLGERNAVTKADTTWTWYDPKTVLCCLEGRVWYPEFKTEGPYQRLAAIELKEHRVTAAELLRPDSLAGLPVADWNDYLVSWKNRELAAFLRDATAAELEDCSSQIERLILKANEDAEREKDAAQQLIKKGDEEQKGGKGEKEGKVEKESRDTSGAELHAQAARAYLARVELLKPILRAVKDELASRRR